MDYINTILGVLGGGSAILTALFAYFGNLRLEKFKSDLSDTNAKLKASLDSSVHVSKAQFDKGKNTFLASCDGLSRSK
jgi:hypothetical protein